MRALDARRARRIVPREAKLDRYSTNRIICLMIQNTLVASIVLAGIVVADSAATQTVLSPQSLSPARLDIPEQGVTLPMQDVGGRPVVDVRINGKGPYRFILDTGATITVIGDGLNQELALKAPRGMMVAPSGRGPAPAIVAVHELRVGDALLGDSIAAVMPLPDTVDSQSGVQGVLSALGFPGYLLTIDYPAKRIRIQKGALPAPDSQTIFEYGAEQALPTVPLRVAGRDVRPHVDTGSGFGLTLPTRFVTEVPLASQPQEVRRVKTPHGEFAVSTARLNGRVELGKYQLDVNEISFSDVSPGPGPAVGNIGSDILHQFIVTLDSANRRVRFLQ
jgi:predicted aspartyl protease